MVVSQKPKQGLILSVTALAAALMMLMSGCAGDLYKSCSTEPLDCSDSASCVARPDYQCDTRVCAIYRDQQASTKGFCTKSCEENAECPDGECRTFVIGTGEKYCVPSNKLEDE